MTLYDGQWYESKEEIYDTGSFGQALSSEDTLESGVKVRHYEGLSKDVGRLPHYETLGTGSSAYCVDTGEYYKYEKTTDTWYCLTGQITAQDGNGVGY